MEERLKELELRYTEQQSFVQELSDVIYAQQREIETLTRRLEQLEKKLEGEPGLVDAKANEPPPHY